MERRKINCKEENYRHWVRLLWKEVDGELQWTDYLFGDWKERNKWHEENMLMRQNENGNVSMPDDRDPDWIQDNLIINRFMFCYGPDLDEDEAYENSWDFESHFIG